MSALDPDSLLEDEIRQMKSVLRDLRKIRNRSNNDSESFFGQIHGYLSERADWRTTVRACSLMADSIAEESARTEASAEGEIL